MPPALVDELRFLHDAEAISIWQTSLAVGSGLPEVYEWMGQAWLRMDLIPQARSAFAETGLSPPYSAMVAEVAFTTTS